MGVTITTMETIENPLEIEGDLETEEEVRGTEVGNPPIQEILHIQDRDRDLTADTVETSQGPQMIITDKNLTDQRMVGMKGVVGAKDTSPRMTGEVSMAMVVGAEKSARRPCFMGGLLQAPPWPDSHQKTHPKASGQIQKWKASLSYRPPLGKYQGRGNPRGTYPD